MSCAPRNFSFSQVAAAGEKRARISKQSGPMDLAFRELLSRMIPVVAKFRSKFRQMNFFLQVTTEHEILK